MLPQRPDHIPQELWELELPSILGSAHPRLSKDDEDSDGDAAAGARYTGNADVMNASSAASCSSRPFPLDFQGPQPTSVYSPVTWSDLWNMPDENAVLALSFALGDAPQSPARPDSALDRLAYDICQLGHCTMAQMARLCSELPGQQVAKRRKRCTSDGETGRRQHTFSVGAFAAGGTVGVQNNTRRYPWTTRLFTAMVHGACPAHHFSSCSLLMNVMHYKHKDHGNAAHTLNLLIPCSRWRGGQIWAADEAGSVLLDSCSEPGSLRAVEPPFTVLDPHKAHATYPWTDGDRIILIAHHAKGLTALKSEESLLRRRAGFMLLEGAGD